MNQEYTIDPNNMNQESELVLNSNLISYSEYGKSVADVFEKSRLSILPRDPSPNPSGWNESRRLRCKRQREPCNTQRGARQTNTSKHTKNHCWSEPRGSIFYEKQPNCLQQFWNDIFMIAFGTQRQTAWTGWFWAFQKMSMMLLMLLVPKT